MKITSEAFVENKTSHRSLNTDACVKLKKRVNLKTSDETQRGDLTEKENAL